MNILMSIKNYFCPERKYVVREGNHFADGKSPMILKLKKDRKIFIQSNPTWVYFHSREEDQSAINKIIGLSEEVNPHINSWRVGYSYSVNDNSINLYFYEYNNEIRNSYFVKKIQIGDSFILRVNMHGGIFLDDIYIGRINSRAKYGFLLEPYFGGKMPAPHDWEILAIIF